MERSRESGSDGNPAVFAPTRRTLLKAIGAGAALTGFGTSGGAAQSTEPWSIVALPDTQRYAVNWVINDDAPNYAGEQTEWIAENRDAENIAFVSHLGDVVDRAFIIKEWEYMDEVMSVLDGVVPYSTVPGNHDWEEANKRNSSIADYQKHFGPSRHEGRGYFGGAGPTNGEENRDGLNTYQLFSAGGYDFLHLGLEWEAPGDVNDPSTPLGWAQEVLDENPDRPTILTTHSYLRDNPIERLGVVEEESGDGNTGKTVWEELVAPNSQVFMVLCGHWYRGDGEAHQVSTNDADEAVYEIMSNYQSRDEGGEGLLRQIRFRPGEGGSDDAPDRIDVRTYSPSTDEEETDSNSRFGFDLDFEARFTAASNEATSTPTAPTTESAGTVATEPTESATADRTEPAATTSEERTEVDARGMTTGTIPGFEFVATLAALTLFVGRRVLGRDER